MGIFISLSKTIECVVIALCFGLFLMLAAAKLLAILQQSGYSGVKMIKWLKKKGNMYFSRLSLLMLLCLFSSAIIAICFSFTGSIAAILSLIPFVIFFTVFLCADKKIALRVPCVHTKRYKRLNAVLYLVCAVFVYIAVTLLNFADYVWGQQLFTSLKYCVLAFFPVLLVALVCLANVIDKIYEVPRNKSYLKKAAAKVKESGITVIGITGSYGKTTQKNILAAMLSKKYRVLATPASYNTPMGIAVTVNKEDLTGYDILIAEMGAKNVGDISQLCKAFPPEYAVITGICPQHLETFLSVENIIKEKGEIFTLALKKAYIAKDCAQYYKDYNINMGSKAAASDIKADCSGTAFTLTIDGISAEVHTRLLGSHSAENIALAASVAYDMGVSLKDIALAAQELDYVEHRLQLIKSGNVNIIDDGYNANVNGAKAALEVLNTFGGRKIIVTPGIVELGVLQDGENREFGGMLAGLDTVILVGDTLITPVKEGYLQAGGDSENLIIKPTLKEAQQELKLLLQDGDTVLFLNDLPDIY